MYFQLIIIFCQKFITFTFKSPITYKALFIFVETPIILLLNDDNATCNQNNLDIEIIIIPGNLRLKIPHYKLYSVLLPCSDFFPRKYMWFHLTVTSSIGKENVQKISINNALLFEKHLVFHLDCDHNLLTKYVVNIATQNVFLPTKSCWKIIFNQLFCC